MPQLIGVLAHPRRPQTAETARHIADSLRAQGIEVWMYADWDDALVREPVQKAQVVIAIGGDGAMLRAARVCAPFQVPVLGINTGRLGFLTEIARPEDWQAVMPRILQGNYWIESRIMIRAALYESLDDGTPALAWGDALNDVVIGGNSLGNMVQLDLYLDGNWATTYNSDALIIATPTGSTAYALAAGGPILPPDLLNILIVPTAPHLSMDRSIVLSEGTRVDVLPSAHNRNPVVVTVDGAPIGNLGELGRVRIRASEHQARFVRLRERTYFYRSLLDKMEPRINRPPERVLRLDED